jgi:predicted transcriptional regulator
MHGGMEFMRSDIVRCAVEWYDATLREQDAVLDRADDLTLGRCVHKVYVAREALKEAVRRWKEAQA